MGYNDATHHMAWIANVPKNPSLNGTGGFMNYTSSATNFGENDQESVYLDIDITKKRNQRFPQNVESRGC